MSESGVDMMWALVLEDGRLWGAAACQQQKDDAKAVFSAAKPHRHFMTRPRGGSKSTDLAGVALSWLATEAPPRANGRVVAATVDQAAILIDAAAGFVARTPELQGVIEIQTERIVGPNGAWIKILSQSDSGAWGLRDCHLIVLDEFAQWPETRGAKRVYTAMRSTVQKVDGCRLIILTSSGEPSHWYYTDVFAKALKDPLWRVSEMPGPVPWHDPQEIEALRNELTPSQFDRLVLNVPAEDEDRAVSEEDYDLAAVLGGTQPPQEGVKYIVTLDVGIYNDATVAVVAHRELKDPSAPNSGYRVVIDVLQRWAGSRKRPVQLSAVKAFIMDAARKYNRAEIYADPSQAVGLVQEINKEGVRAQEWVFTQSRVGQVATALVMAFRNRLILLTDSPALRSELLAVRLRESAP
ncbi:MAG TPA: terminase large subunit, partial [Acidimicrobiales bacterium]|nr:terminase large subunit [Acidimicrobiales bacterium]